MSYIDGFVIAVPTANRQHFIGHAENAGRNPAEITRNEIMANAHGDFIWYELLTTDAEAARTFYADVIGWTATDSGQPAIDYRILAAAEGNVGGLMQITDDMRSAGARPVWLGYIAVDDVDRTVAAITAAGGANP